jgi:transposase
MARLHTQKIELSADERKQLEQGCSAGDWKARKIRRARVFLLADVGPHGEPKPLGDAEIAKRAGCSKSSVGNLRKSFQSQRLGALDEKPRSGRPKIVDGELEAKMIAISCSEAPEGRERWTLRLIADKLVTLVDDLDDISYTTVGKTLKKTNSNPG